MVLRRSTTFTIHALDRVAERLTMDRTELAELLDRGRAVTLGVDEYSNRLRRLFYSAQDEQFFVAVQDVKTGDVVTVLPLEYYANLHGFVPEKRVVEAAALVGAPAPDVRMMRGVMPKPDPSINAGASVIRISVVTEREDGTPNIKNLGSWPADEAPAQLDALAHEPRFLRELCVRARAKGLELRPPFRITLKMGKSGDGLMVGVESWPTGEESQR